MDTSQVSSTFTTSQVGAANHAGTHPLSPLTASEIVKGRDLIHGLYPSATNFQFKGITLQEPEKAQLVPYLEAEHSGRRLPLIDRKAFICYYIRNTVSGDFGFCASSTYEQVLKLECTGQSSRSRSQLEPWKSGEQRQARCQRSRPCRRRRSPPGRKDCSCGRKSPNRNWPTRAS